MSILANFPWAIAAAERIRGRRDFTAQERLEIDRDAEIIVDEALQWIGTDPNKWDRLASEAEALRSEIARLQGEIDEAETKLDNVERSIEVIGSIRV